MVKKIDKKLSKEMKKEVDREVKKEIEKRLHKRIYHKTVGSALKFKNEFKSEVVVAITAAFAFLIALSWRAPIQTSIDKLIVYLGLVGKEIYVQYLSAIFITIVAVLALMVMSRWKSKED